MYEAILILNFPGGMGLMLMLYINNANVVRVDKVKAESAFIERSGYHISPPESVFRERLNRDEAVTVVVQDRIMAFNAPQGKEDIELVMQRIDVGNYLKKPMSVDSEFMRWLKMAFKNAGPILIILIGIGIAFSMMGG